MDDSYTKIIERYDTTFITLIWNQRKQNAWLWAELLLVSVFLWFLVDYLYVMGRTYTAPLGFDIRHTYSIVISSLSERSPDYIPKEKRSGRMVFIC